jgi:DNA polymerase/3'-5' exonuclease PolX
MDDVPFKPRAYEKAALSIEALEEDVEEIYRLDADGQPPKTSLTQERLNSLKNAEKII